MSNCPNCGRFLSAIMAARKGGMIQKVTGECLKCGVVDISDREWWTDDFVWSSDAAWYGQIKRK